MHVLFHSCFSPTLKSMIDLDLLDVVHISANPIALWVGHKQTAEVLFFYLKKIVSASDLCVRLKKKKDRLSASKRVQVPIPIIRTELNVWS